MKAERQQKEPQKAEPIQSKRNRSMLSFVDNRPQTVSQTKLIKSIQKKENKIGFSDDLKTQEVNINDNEELENGVNVMEERINNDGKCIQGKFYVKYLENYILHEENPNLELYQETGDFYENESVYIYKTKRGNIDFQEGEDIIYGLDKPRKTVLDSLGRKDGDKRIFIQNDITNAVWNPVIPSEYLRDEDIEGQLNDADRAKRFRSFLQADPNFNVATQNLNPVDSWKKTSKAGLKFQLIQEKKDVIFIVDELELSCVVDKHSANPIYKNRARQITSGEIRWLYRNKDNENVKQHLKLYENGILLNNEEFFNRPEWEIYKINRERKHHDVQSKGCCFLTTACVTHKGLPDDCEELTILRHFRDTYLINKLNGKDLIAMYYARAPYILANIHKRRKEEEEMILESIYGIVRECVDAILSGDNEFAFRTYCDMVVRLDSEYGN